MVSGNLLGGVFDGRDAYAIHRAGRQTKFTSSAFAVDYGVSVSVCTHYGVNGACVQTQRTADAGRLIDNRNPTGFVHAVSRINFCGTFTQQPGDGRNRGVTAGSTLVNFRLAG
jgi:hypothetical protein